MHEADVLYCNQIMGFLFYFKATTTEAGEWDDWKLRRGWHFEWVYHNLKGDKLSVWTYIEELNFTRNAFCLLGSILFLSI